MELSLLSNNNPIDYDETQINYGSKNSSCNYKLNTLSDYNNENKYKIQISRYGDIVNMNNIMCYNCSEDFKIKEIELQSTGFNCLTKINMIEITKFINCIETYIIDGNRYICYNLKKLNIIPEICILSTPFSSLYLYITIESGISEKICLDSNYIFLDTPSRNELRNNIIIKKNIKSFKTYDIVNYQNGNNINITNYNAINGISISDININNINKIVVYINNTEYIKLIDKFDILINTKKIKENIIYIPFNNVNNFFDNINPNNNVNFNHQLHFKIYFDNEINNVNFKIHIINFNKLHYEHGFLGLTYFNNGNNNNNDNNNNDNNIWNECNKILNGNNECPVTLNILKDKYIKCNICNNNFDILVIEEWIKKKKKKICPMCRGKWTNFVIYINK